MRLEATSAAVAHARLAFEAWLRDTGADDETLEELTMVFSELVANPTDAPPSNTAELIEASAWTEDRNIVLRVANPVTSSSPPVAAHDYEDRTHSRGRGLLIVRAFTDTMTVAFDDGAIVVRCKRSIRSFRT